MASSKLVHVVVFTPSEPEGAGTGAFVDGLRGLSGAGTNDFLCAGVGVSVDSREQGDDGHYKRSTRAALVSEFADEAGLGAYATSPAHVAVVEDLIKPCLAGPPCALDYLAPAAPVDAAGVAWYHVVLFKLKDGTAAGDYAAAAAALQALESMQGVVSLSMGENIPANARNQGFTHCFVASYDSQAALDAYLKDETALAALKLLTPHVDAWMSIDFPTK